jgi:DNA recombination protein RmuC
MEIIMYIIVGIIIGSVLGWLSGKGKIERDLIKYRATADANLETAARDREEKMTELSLAHADLKTAQNELTTLKEKMATLSANHGSLQELWEADKNKLTSVERNLDTVKAELVQNERLLATANADLRGANELLETGKQNAEVSKLEIKTIKDDLNRTAQSLATATAENKALSDKLQTQHKEMEEMGKKFNTEFENIANKILDTKSEKFTELNKTNMTSILEPLGKNLNDFRTKVEEVYDKEAKERFSLGEKVKELAQLNQMISDDARNLTKALKGESKTQGNWGEMILESILERSGLVKDREYFMEHQLTDEDGKPLTSASEGKKMRPDAVIKYPDKRSVIIDSKVSLNAFTRLIAATDPDEQKKELAAHIQAIKAHIVTLSAKGYDDYNQALDFVMLFVPSEPAYIAALQSDADLWNFAYDKRILLLSPTNLITSLKLIVDLWKREYQNKNAIDIAERGTKLYEKFVGFVDNLTAVGQHLEKAQGKYTDAFKQLSTGSDNLVLQADKLKKLGVKTKKNLPDGILNVALSDELIEGSHAIG